MKLDYEIIDLSLPFYKDMPKYDAKWFPPYRYEEISPENLNEDNWKRRFTRIDLFAHNGTHVEVSDHVYKDGNILKNYGIDQFIGYPIIIDLTDAPLKKEITKEQIAEKMKNKEIEENSILLLKTLYDDKHWGEADFWCNSPWLSQEAALFIKSFKPSFVGIDFQTEKPKEKDYIVHKILTKDRTILCEYLFHLDKITEDCLFMALPINFVDLEASPIRASALRFKK